MSIIKETAYNHSQKRHRYRGLVLKNPEFNKYLQTRVNARFYDSKGKTDLRKKLDGIKSSKFDPDFLKLMFEDNDPPRDWEIGEKISECFLEDHCNCIFPYNDKRDAKNPGSNLPGADLVGFVKIDNKILFLFGEVKTSDQDQYPPSVVYGKEGLINQLKEIRDKPNKRMDLIKWLGHKPESSKDDNEWTKAVISYTTNEFKIFGVMIRGVTPDERDLKLIFKEITSNIKDEPYLELLSLYIPIMKTQYVGVMDNVSTN